MTPEPSNASRQATANAHMAENTGLGRAEGSLSPLKRASSRCFETATLSSERLRPRVGLPASASCVLAFPALASGFVSTPEQLRRRLRAGISPASLGRLNHPARGLEDAGVVLRAPPECKLHRRSAPSPPPRPDFGRLFAERVTSTSRSRLSQLRPGSLLIPARLECV